MSRTTGTTRSSSTHSETHQPPPPPPPRNEENDDTTTTTTATTTSYPFWHHWVAGGTAGLCSRMVTAPLDLIRIRRQIIVTTTTTTPSEESILTSWRNIVQHEGGISALYRGNMSALYLWMTYAAVQFSIYHPTKELLQQHQQQLPIFSPVLVSFGAGATAGFCATIITYPFDVCRTTFSAYGLVQHQQQQQQHTTTTTTNINQPTSSSSPIRTTPQHFNIAVVPRQHNPAPLPLSSLYEPPILFPSSIANHHHPHHHPHHPSTTTTKPPTASLLAHHHPLRNSTGPLPPPAASPPPLQQQLPLPRTMIQFVQQMYQRQGLRGFYAGVTPALIQIIPYMGCNFAIYDYLTTRRRHGGIADHDDDHSTSPVVSIGWSAYAGSISGAISKMMVYPLDTVKRRLQAQAFFTLAHHEAMTTTTTTLHTNYNPASRHHHPHYNGMYDCIRSIYRLEGWRSFYRGIVPSVLKTAIASSLTFSCFRWTQNALRWTHDVALLR